MCFFLYIVYKLLVGLSMPRTRSLDGQDGQGRTEDEDARAGPLLGNGCGGLANETPEEI